MRGYACAVVDLLRMRVALSVESRLELFSETAASFQESGILSH